MQELLTKTLLTAPKICLLIFFAMFNSLELADFLSTLPPAIHNKYFICSINRNIHKTCCKGIQPVWELE